ncbi:uncharacterized protein E5676_scaffold2510G00680 [Cucumis melo var. makuwa]|uniref:Uncharacterized protein n=1 Tax=Cucumis melo var. makuwa TaxID=1194695 RepID=A0A5D3BK22_CUCMM|nr:uncharacterized protein E5676_scaffold2510G00680 [Cucumis melo var. makuwa]
MLLQLHKLHEWHSQAYENAKIYKEKTKVWHDHLIRKRELPFAVKEIFPHGAVEIGLLDKKNVFKTRRRCLAAVVAISSYRSAASGASPPPFKVAPLHRSCTVRERRSSREASSCRFAEQQRPSIASATSSKVHAQRLSHRPNPESTHSRVASPRAQTLQPRPWDFRRLGERVVTARTDMTGVIRRDRSQPKRFRYSLGNYQGPACPYGAHVARVRGRASSGVEAEVGTRASWRVTRSDHGNPSHSRSVRPDSKQAQRPKKKAMDSVLGANEWMRHEEAIYKDLTHLEPWFGVTDHKDDTQPGYKCVKHDASFK